MLKIALAYPMVVSGIIRHARSRSRILHISRKIEIRKKAEQRFCSCNKFEGCESFVIHFSHLPFTNLLEQNKTYFVIFEKLFNRLLFLLFSFFSMLCISIGQQYSSSIYGPYRSRSVLICIFPCVICSMKTDDEG